MRTRPGVGGEVMEGNRVRGGLLVVGLAVAATLLLSCAVNPVTGRQEIALISEAQEIEIGTRSDPEVLEKYGYYPDPALQAYLRSVGEPLARVSHRPSLAYHFKVVDSPAVNAFALPGGYVYVTRGILAHLDNEAELAGVLGHEIGHITERHAVQQLSAAMGLQLTSLILSSTVQGAGEFSQLTDILFSGILHGYGRGKEFRADSLGQLYMTRAGYDPGAMVALLSTLERTQGDPLDPVTHWVVSSHPYAAERIRRARSRTGELVPAPGAGGRRERERYLARIDGLLFGPGPREGIITEGGYRNGYFRAACDTPRGWKARTQRDRWIAESPDKALSVQMRFEELKNTLDAEAYASAVEGRTGLQQGRLLERGVQGGWDLIAREYRGRVQGAPVLVRGAYLIRGRRAAALIGIGPESRPAAMLQAWEGVLRSLRVLSETEAAEVPLLRIRLHRVRPGETYEELARIYLKDAGSAGRIAEINGMEIGEVPMPGKVIKVIAPGPGRGGV